MIISGKRDNLIGLIMLGVGENMKRIIVLFLAFAMFSSAFTYATAEEIDFSTYDDAALVKLLSDIQAEIAKRGIEKTASLLQGNYSCPEDIPAGTYILHATAGERTNGIIWVADPGFTIQSNGSPDKYSLHQYIGIAGNKEGDYKITLKEGSMLHLPCPATLTILSGVLFQ